MLQKRIIKQKQRGRHLVVLYLADIRSNFDTLQASESELNLQPAAPSSSLEEHNIIRALKTYLGYSIKKKMIVLIVESNLRDEIFTRLDSRERKKSSVALFYR
jgi:hypothetical protein